jgi:hypothetical protein
MNEQIIKQLMLEAGYAAPELAGRANKLAELIVRECINACGSDFGTELIKKHFGVER